MTAPDLSQFMIPPGEPNLGFHQGTIISWDAQTGQNVVRVLGADLEDLATLNLTETLTLEAGMQVGILRYKSQLFILGRVVVPNTPSFFSGAMPDMPAAFYNVHTDDVLQTNSLGAWTSKLVGGYVINHPMVSFGVRCQVSGAAAVGGWRVQWYLAHPGGGSDPAGGTLMGTATGLPAPGLVFSAESYVWPAGLRGQLVYVSYEVMMTAGVAGTDWVSAVPTHFVGRPLDL